MMLPWRFSAPITLRLRSRRPGYLAALIAAALATSACGAHSRPSTPGGSASSSKAGMPATSIAYQLHMDYFSRESGLSSVIDPQVFVSRPTAAAGTGPQEIHHVAGVTPAAKTDPPGTPLLAADGTPLGITLGQWEKAAGSVSLACADGRETAVSRLSGLVPGGTYSVFVVHLNAQMSARFTPFGDAAGTTNNFTASAAGTAMLTNTVAGCLTGQEAVLMVWHSDHRSHGATAGTLGVNWHNSLIIQAP